jgi:hypothetical protein
MNTGLAPPAPFFAPIAGQQNKKNRQRVRLFRPHRTWLSAGVSSPTRAVWQGGLHPQNLNRLLPSDVSKNKPKVGCVVFCLICPVNLSTPLPVVSILLRDASKQRHENASIFF